MVTDPVAVAFVCSLVKGKSLQLLYRGSRDGWKYRDFHDRCDNKGATLTLFKTDDGRVCGGYTSVSWESPKSWEFKADPSAFVFSVDHQRVFNINNDQTHQAICCDSIRGPSFGYIGCIGAFF